MSFFKKIIAMLTITCLLSSNAFAQDSLIVGTWNIANLHHENNVPLRSRAASRDMEDFERLREFAESLNFDIVALQEIGSPAALSRVFPETDFHLVISDRYSPGDENKPLDERDIYVAFAVRKSTFPAVPVVSNLHSLSIDHIEVDSSGNPSNRPTRQGLVLTLEFAEHKVKFLNVHMKSSCHGNSIDPVYDTSKTGKLNNVRYDCRTVVAQAMIFENWLEQQFELGNGVVVLGDFNRRLNRFEGTTNKEDHYWDFIDDGFPTGFDLTRGPTGINTNCWPKPHKLYNEEHIDFIVYDNRATTAIAITDIQKVGLPFAEDPKYTGYAGQKLSDHCPVVGRFTKSKLK